MKYKYKYEMKQNNIWIPPMKKEFFLVEMIRWSYVEAIRELNIVDNIFGIFYTFKVVLKQQLHFILF